MLYEVLPYIGVVVGFLLGLLLPSSKKKKDRPNTGLSMLAIILGIIYGFTDKK